MPPSSPPVLTAPLPPGVAPFLSADLAGPDCHAPAPTQSIPPSSRLLRVAPPPRSPSFSALHSHSSRCCPRTPAACPPRRADSSELFSPGATAASPSLRPPAPEFLALPTPPSIPAQNTQRADVRPLQCRCELHHRICCPPRRGAPQQARKEASCCCRAKETKTYATVCSATTAAQRQQHRKRKKTNKRKEKEHGDSPRNNAQGKKKKDPHVSGIKLKVAKQLKQQHPKPAGKRRRKENRETKTKQDRHRNRARKNRLRHERNTTPKAARRAHRRTACTCALVLHGIRRRRRRPKPRPYPARGVHWWGQKKSHTTGTHRKKRRTREAANKRPLAQQNAASQYMSILHEVYSGIGARATEPSHRADYGYQGPP